MSDIIDENMATRGRAVVVRRRIPPFLKVICILTFVGSGLAFFKNIFTLTTFNFTKVSMQAFSTVSPLLSKPQAGPFSIFSANAAKVNTFLNWTLWGAWIGLIACLLTLTGALLMWQLKKVGFYIYIVAEVAVLFSATMMLIASSGVKFFGVQSLIMSIMVMVTTIGFIVMYILNLKHLK